MKNKLIKLFSVLISAILFINIMPFNIYSDDSPTGTYASSDDLGYCITYGDYVWNNNYRYYQHLYISNTNSEVRYVSALNGNNGYMVYAVSLDTFRYKGESNTTSACSPLSGYDNSINYTYNGVVYRVASHSVNSSNYIISTNYGSVIPITSKGSKSWNEWAVYYSFGAGAVDPEPPITSGNLTFNYYTDFASTQQNNVNALKSNRDTIIWDYDTSNSNIPGTDLKVDIRAVPTKYYSSTETGLDSLSWGDLSIESSYAADLGSYQMNWNNRKVSFTWEEVVNNIKYDSNLPDYYDQMVNFWNFKKRFTGNYWYYTGWVYQIRLNTYSGDYTGEWQTIYQISSAPPEESTQVINYYVTGTGLPQDVYQTIQNVNNQNNVTNNTWYINGSPFDVNDETGQNWWETLLQFIRDLVSEILSFLGSIFDSLINAIFGLIEDLGIDFLGLFQTLLNGIVDFFHNLDLTGINFQLPQSFNNFIQGFSGSVNGILGIWINNGLAVFIFVPLIIWLIGVIL